MNIECENDPNYLIGMIGDPNFIICDYDIDEIYRHPKHPDIVRIIDCEFERTIDVCGENPGDSMIMAMSLCKLLNQDYIFKPPGE